jgi:hypothetical protein
VRGVNSLDPPVNYPLSAVRVYTRMTLVCYYTRLTGYLFPWPLHSSELHATVIVHTTENRRYPQNSRVGGRNSRSGSCAEQINVLPLLHIEPPLPAKVAQALTGWQCVFLQNVILCNYILMIIISVRCFRNYCSFG